ncbi:DUF421 domain-containing protein [Niallia oryzisoli]|uniref:DUF421 domain-containing protein n=1 Tax=Niallia oryzisoli TaxID=1737571 RepID=A0ABZ2C997_9BACI
MEFFHGQESLTTLQWVLRAVVTYLFLLLSAKIMGQRSISQLRLIDFVMALIIGNIMAHPLSDEHLGLKGSMISMSALIILYLCTILLILKFQGIRNLLHGQAFPLIKDSQIIYKNLAKARISLDVLLSEIRKQKVSEVHHVSLALWEPDGTISIFLNPQQQTITKADMKIQTKPFSFPRTVIKEGKLNIYVLHEIGKDEEWLKERIKSSYNVELHHILLATIDQKNNLKVFLYS